MIYVLFGVGEGANAAGNGLDSLPTPNQMLLVAVGRRLCGTLLP